MNERQQLGRYRQAAFGRRELGRNGWRWVESGRPALRRQVLESGRYFGSALAMSTNDFDIELDELQRQSTGRLLSAEIFDRDAFQALREHICRKAEQIRNEFVVSKQLLACLRGASGAIRNQAAHVAAARDHLSVADDFELLLDLIIAGEGCEDRRPGNPRIV